MYATLGLPLAPFSIDMTSMRPARRDPAAARFPALAAACLAISLTLTPATATGNAVDMFVPGGTATTVSDAILAVDAGGTVVITGLFDETPAFDPLTMMMKEARMVSSMVYRDPGEGSDFAIALVILAERSDALRAVISHTFPMNRAQEAFETAGDKSTGAIKVLLGPAEA